MTVAFEEDCLRHSFTIKTWIRYYEHKKDATHDEKVFILHRAVKELPRSYKLWKLLLDLLVNRLLNGKAMNGQVQERNSQFPPNHREWQLVNSYFERCLVLCNKFPKIWFMYCNFLMHQPTRITFTRRTFDRALKSLPITQHKSLWDLYLSFAVQAGGDTAIRIWRRFLKIQPTHGTFYLK